MPYTEGCRQHYTDSGGRKVPTPGWLNYERYGTFANIYAGAPAEKAYAWTIAQVKSILKEETYIGHSVHNKQSNISFKNKKKVRKPQEEWYRVENTHEAIISEEVFQKVQELIASRRRKRRNGTTQIFAGLIKCADCGWSLAYGENKQNKNIRVLPLQQERTGITPVFHALYPL